MRDERLNELLDAWRVEPASIKLRERVAASAPRGRVGDLWVRKTEGVRFWLAGMGLAAGLAGVSCGIVFSNAAVREAQAEAVVASVTTEASAAISPLAESSAPL